MEHTASSGKYCFPSTTVALLGAGVFPIVIFVTIIDLLSVHAAFHRIIHLRHACEDIRAPCLEPCRGVWRAPRKEWAVRT